MNTTDYEHIAGILTGKDIKELNAIESLITVLRGPIAKRKGISFTPEECEIWVEEIEKFYNDIPKSLPKWEKCDTCTSHAPEVIGVMTDWIIKYDGYSISMNDLQRLPKED